MSGGGLSLAFTGPSKKTRRLELHDKGDAVVREEVIGVGASGVQTASAPASTAGPKIIAAQPNSYKAASGKFRPSYLPEAADRAEEEGGIDKFEIASHDTAEAQAQVTYGLIRRDRTGEASTSQRAEREAAPGDLETLALRRDLTALPEVASLEAYEAMPVEAFGEALLRGMGWKEGAGLGKGGKEPAQPKDLKRRPARLGLGASAAPVPTHKKYIKPGESRAVPDVAPVENKAAAKIPLAERSAADLVPGQRAWVVRGQHSGLACVFVALERKQEGRSARAQVRLHPSNESASVRLAELSLAPPESFSGTKGDRGEGNRGGSTSGMERGGVDVHRQASGKGSGLRPLEHPAEDERSPWLVPDIRVKIVDKRAEGGRIYLKKGTVVDVSLPGVCDVRLDDPAITVQNVRQSQMETVVPAREGTPVLLLVGRLRGKHARLLQRDTERGAAAVQLTSDGSLERVLLDDLAEYVGPEPDH